MTAIIIFFKKLFRIPLTPQEEIYDRLRNVQEAKPLVVAPAPTPIPPQRPTLPKEKRPPGLPPSNHFFSRDRKTLESEYEFLWPLAKLSGPMASDAEKHAAFIIQNRKEFEAVDQALGMPWYIVACLSTMEMGLNFKGTILNGDDWHEQTYHYPAGLGPWKSWVHAAIWGIQYEVKRFPAFSDIRSYPWKNVGSAFFFLECWNGQNARIEPQYSLTTPKGASPYIYSGTQFYVKGKKQEKPSRFTPDLVSQQPGCMAILLALKNSGIQLF